MSPSKYHCYPLEPSLYCLDSEGIGHGNGDGGDGGVGSSGGVTPAMVWYAIQGRANVTDVSD